MRHMEVFVTEQDYLCLDTTACPTPVQVTMMLDRCRLAKRIMQGTSLFSKPAHSSCAVAWH